MKNLIPFLQQKGFIWGPSPEIYGGVAGFYTYAPLGKLLKNNVENAIRKIFQKYEFFEVECPIVMPKVVWEASGHLGGFTDPVIECSSCQAIFRADNLINELYPDVKTEGLKFGEILDLFEELKLKCPNCKGHFKNEIKTHNLMMKTTIGLNQEAYNRPETATTTYLPFIRFNDYFRKKIPFSIFQIGKAFRNEISPRQHVLRMREFTQAEGQIFIFKNQKKQFKKYEKIKDKILPIWDAKSQKDGKVFQSISVDEALIRGYFKNEAYAWLVYLSYELFTSIGIPSEKIRLRQHMDNEKAFYADDAYDLEIQLNSFGWTECCGIHDRTDYDLTQHSIKSKKNLMGDNEGEKETPQILEIAFGTDRPTFAILDLFYDKKEKEEGKTKLNIPYNMAPIKAAIFPLMKKEGMPELAKKIFEDLIKHIIVRYDESGSIGKRYLREDSIGTPYCITVDFDSLENKDVTIRDRNSEKQTRIKISDLKETIEKLLKKEINFESLLKANV